VEVSVHQGRQLDRLDADGAAEPAPVVLLGASYMAAWTLQAVGGRRVVNVSIPGSQTHEYVARFDADVAALGPRAVVIWGIDNDIIRAPQGQTAEACRRVEANLAALIEMARARGIEPILSTDMTLRGPARWYEGLAALAGRLRGKEGYQQRINAHVLRLNERIRELAAATGTRLLDLYPLTVDHNGRRRREYAKRDGSHLTEAAYKAIEAYAVPRLEAWLAEPAARPAEAREPAAEAGARPAEPATRPADPGGRPAARAARA
jgi:lysophospholipase L1-like esterase